MFLILKFLFDLMLIVGFFVGGVWFVVEIFWLVEVGLYVIFIENEW